MRPSWATKWFNTAPSASKKASGYEIRLQSIDFIAHTYNVVGRDGIGLSVSSISSGEDRNYTLGTLIDVIHQSLEIR